MSDKDSFKRILIYILVVCLFILAAIVLKPVIASIIYGLLLAYIFYPVYKWVLSRVKNENLAALIICIGLLIVIFVVASLLFTSLIKQITGLYLSLQEANFVNIVRGSLPEKLASSELSASIVNALNSSFSKILAGISSRFGDFIINLPIILLQLFVVIFTFFFSLRDGKKAFEYLKSLSPLEKDTEKKFFDHLTDITNSVLIGQIVVGIIQGAVAGIGYFIFGVPNALLLTFLTMLVGIIPIIGPWLVWIPVCFYLFITGRSGAGIGLLIYGLLIVSWLDTLIRPAIVSRKTQVHSAIILVGMIGGLFVFGILGLIIGPLVLAYILLVIELYRKKTIGKDLVFKKVR